MSLSPPPQQKEFNWIWQKWLHDLWLENDSNGIVGEASTVTLTGDVIGSGAFDSGGDTSFAATIDLPTVTCISGGDAAETFPGAVSGPYGAYGNYGPAAAGGEYCPGYTYTRVDDNEFTVDLVNAENLFYVGRRVKFDKSGTYTYGVISAVDFDTTSADDTHVTLTMEGSDTVPTGSFDACFVTSATNWSPIAGDPFGGGVIRDIATGVIGSTQWWVIVGDGGNIATSTDGGDNWTTRSAGSADLRAVVYNVSTETFWAGGGDVGNTGGVKLWYSTDGTTWTQKTGAVSTADGDYIISMDYSGLSGYIGVLYIDSSSGPTACDTFKTVDEFASGYNDSIGVYLGIFADSNPAGSNVASVFRAGDVGEYTGGATDITLTTGTNPSTGSITGAERLWYGSVSREFLGLDNGDILVDDTYLDDVTFAYAIRSFALSTLHGRVVCVGDNGIVGYGEWSAVTTAVDSWNSVANGFAPTANVLAVEFNETDGVFVAVADNGQICRSSTGIT